MVQFSKFWFINPSTNICPSCGNIHSIKMVINNKLTGEETLKTINFRPHFCIKNHKKWNNSFFPPWMDLKSHIPGTVLTIRFFWCITRLWTRKFLLLGFLDSVPQPHGASNIYIINTHSNQCQRFLGLWIWGWNVHSVYDWGMRHVSSVINISNSKWDFMKCILSERVNH